MSATNQMQAKHDAAREQAEKSLPQGCHRSHPHEDMDAGCQRLTEIARENNRVRNEQAENEMICEKLLGWKKLGISSFGVVRWGTPPSWDEELTPTFTTWAEAGLILEALQKAIAIEVPQLGHQLSCYRFTPEHIRSAALSYLRSLER